MGTIVTCFETLDPLEHAVSWNSPPARRMEPAEYAETVQRWYRFYAAHEIGALSFGAVVFSRGANGRPWSLIRRVASQPGSDAARQVSGSSRDTSCSSDRPTWRFAGLPSLTASVSASGSCAETGGWVQKLAVARTADELGVSADVDVDALDTVFRCSGGQPLGELIPSRSSRSIVISSLEQLLRSGLLDIDADSLV